MTGTERSKLALGGIVLGAVALLAVNLLSHTGLKGMRLDLTEEKLYTISEGTMSVLASLDEPLTARLYVSRILGEKSPRYGLYADRVTEMLERYASLSAGKFKLEVLDPEPFTDAEDRAMAAGLQGVPVTAGGEQAYFGLSVATTTDLEAVIPFFTLEREAFIEYDLTKLVYTLANPTKKSIGLITALPIDGKKADGPMGPRKRWVIMDQIREFFDVRMIEGDATEIPDDIETLMVVHPKGLTDGALYAVDQFVLRGGNALVFVDAHAELEVLGSPLLTMEEPDKFDFNKVLEGWGVRLVTDKVAGDRDAARRVQTGTDPRRPVVIDYVAWMELDQDNFDGKDVITADIERVHLATAGILETVEGATTTVTPLLSTGTNSMAINADKVRSATPDVVGLYRDFKPGNVPLTLSARVTGQAKTGFPDGAPAEVTTGLEGEALKRITDSHRAASDGPVNVIVVADVDMLYDQFWVSVREMLDQKVLVPLADNGTFVVNALDALAGSDALISLRGRGVSDRPFHLVEDIRRNAEREFRAKEEELLEKLKALQGELSALQRKGQGGGEAIVSAEDRARIQQGRAEMVSVRRELRDVQRALRKDIESLEARLTFLNIAGLPLVLGLGTLAAWGVRRSRRKAQGGAR